MADAKPFTDYKTTRERLAETHERANQIRHAATAILAATPRYMRGRELAEKLGVSSYIIERSLRYHPKIIRKQRHPKLGQHYLHTNWYPTHADSA